MWTEEVYGPLSRHAGLAAFELLHFAVALVELVPMLPRLSGYLVIAAVERDPGLQVGQTEIIGVGGRRREAHD